MGRDEMTGLPAICIRPGCGRNFTEHIHTTHLMEWCPRCTNLDGTMTETCYCREEYAASTASCDKRQEESAVLTCKFHQRASLPACGETAHAVTVGCVHEHVYRTALCTIHEDCPQRCCQDCWELPKVQRHACQLLVERAA